MGEKIVILGGVGLIGTHLSLRLLNEGHEVYCVDTRDAADSPLLCEAGNRSNFHFIKHNITNNFTISCSQIYNLTAPTRLHYDRALPVETLKINVLGSINVLETARNAQARVLFASSGEIYNTLCRETHSEEHCRNSSKYILAEGKRAGEAFHRAYRNEYGVDTRIARIFNTYGSGAGIEEQRVVMKMIVAALRNRNIEIYGSGEQLRTFCWVGDTVDGLIRLMQVSPTEQTRTVNLGGSHEISIRMLAEKIVTLTGSRSKIIHTEAHFDDVRRLSPNLTAAKCDLGWTPSTSLVDGLRQTIEYAEHELSHTAWSAKSWVEINS